MAVGVVVGGGMLIAILAAIAWWSAPGPPSEEDKGAVVGLDPKTGKTLWSYDGWQCQDPIPNVTAIGDGRTLVFVKGKISSVNSDDFRAVDGPVVRFGTSEATWRVDGDRYAHIGKLKTL